MTCEILSLSLSLIPFVDSSISVRYRLVWSSWSSLSFTCVVRSLLGVSLTIWLVSSLQWVYFLVPRTLVFIYIFCRHFRVGSAAIWSSQDHYWQDSLTSSLVRLRLFSQTGLLVWVLPWCMLVFYYIIGCCSMLWVSAVALGVTGGGIAFAFVPIFSDMLCIARFAKLSFCLRLSLSLSLPFSLSVDLHFILASISSVLWISQGNWSEQHTGSP